MATLGETAVGSSVYLNVDGVRTEFLVVHQGLPDSTLYDASCDGTWLLMKDIYIKQAWGGSNNSYKASSVKTYLNNTFFNLLDTDVRSEIKQVKIPYVNGTGTGSVASGASGFSTKVFLLSGYEIGWTTNEFYSLPAVGAKLSYFDSGYSLTKRIAYMDGVATSWWLRCPEKNDTNYVYYVETNGNSTTEAYYSNLGVRPAFVINSTLSVSGDGDIVTNTAPTAPSGITTPSSVGYGENIPVSWGASTDANGDSISYIVERSIDGGVSWNQVYQGADTSIADSLEVSVVYRVKAVDTMAAESEYTQSSAVELTKGGSGGIYVRQNGVWKPAEAIKIITGGA